MPSGVDILSDGIGCADQGCGCVMLVVIVMVAIGLLSGVAGSAWDYYINHSPEKPPQAAQTTTQAKSGGVKNTNSIVGTWHVKGDPSRTIVFTDGDAFHQQPAGSIDVIPDNGTYLWMGDALNIDAARNNAHLTTIACPTRQRDECLYHKPSPGLFFDKVDWVSSSELKLVDTVKGSQATIVVVR